MEKTICGEFLRAAIAVAKTFPSRDPGVSYFEATLRQRTKGDSMQAGSFFLPEWVGGNGLERRLFSYENGLLWAWQPYPTCHNLAPGSLAMILWWDRELEVNGMVKLHKLPSQQNVKVDDRKGTGFASITVDRPYTDALEYCRHAVAIFTNEGDDAYPKWALATVHPGDPVAPAEIKLGNGLKHGDVISVEEALTLGFTEAKLVTPM